MITVGIYGIADTTHGTRPTYTHDHSVAFMRDGRVLAVVQLERWTGAKHDNRLPATITDLLEHFVPSDEPVRFVSVNAFVGSSFISTDGNLRIEPRSRPGISSELVPADVHWYPGGLRRRPAEGWVLSHEAAHLCSLLPFVGAFEDGALGAHIDGGASDSASSFWAIEGGRPVLREASWDLLKDVVNNFNVNPGVRAILGFPSSEHLSIPGRLMGYAALGTPRDELRTWLEARNWLLDHSDENAAAALKRRIGSVDLRDTACQDLCATLQHAFEERVTREVTARRAGAKTLYLAGGAALNIPTNAALQHHFQDVWVPPCTNDSGLALGAAAWVEHLDHGRLPTHGPFLGAFDCPAGEPPEDAIPEIAEHLLRGEVWGIYSGASEVGPRALGHRSIVARTDDPAIRVRVSETIKRREWYRPVAPILCEAAAREVLHTTAADSQLSRWMLGAWPVRGAWQAALGGVLHADGSVRAQVVRDDGTNTWMHALLHHLWAEQGVPALINTSFNGPGQPIVQRRAEARAAASTLGLDGVAEHGSLHRP